MNSNDEQTNDYRSFLLLEEISKNNEITQRDLSSRLGIALGLINSYIKNLASKGYITVSAIPRKRYKYYLTPEGFIEKTRMTYHHLQSFTNLYRNARQDFQKMFYSLSKNNVRKVVFCGTDEVAEIAYITLREFRIKLVGVVDIERNNKKFFGFSTKPVADLKTVDYDKVIITSFLKGKELHSELLKTGVPPEKILRGRGVPSER